MVWAENKRMKRNKKLIQKTELSRQSFTPVINPKSRMMTQGRTKVFEKLFADAEMLKNKKKQTKNDIKDGMFYPSLNRRSMEIVDGSRIVGFKKSEKKLETDKIDHFTAYNLTNQEKIYYQSPNKTKSEFGEYYYNTHEIKEREVCLVEDHTTKLVQKGKKNPM